jgi:retron-type reverse transcriptase
LGNAKGKERVVASLLFSSTYVSGGDTEEKSNVASKLNKLAVRSNLYPNQKIDRELYSLIYKPEMLIYAYENIKSQPGNMTPGVTPETLDGISKSRIESLSQSLKDESFAFSPARKVQIPKASGGTRPLSVASPRDKIVQEAMKLVLESIYEPLFKDCSHGFRPNKGCHTALQQASRELQPAQ